MQCCQLKSPNTCGSPASIALKGATGKTYTGKPITWVPCFPSIAQAPPRLTLFISNSDHLPLLIPSRGLRITQRKFFQVLPSACMLPPPSLPPCCFHRVQAAGGLSPVMDSPSSPALCGAHSHTVTQLGRHTMPPPNPQSLVQALPLPATSYHGLMLSVFLPVHYLSSTHEGKCQEGRHLVSPSVQGSVSHTAGPQ